MINIDLLKELIEQTPAIKSLFTTESYPMFSMYDRNTGKRKTSGMELQTIYKQPKFLKWKEQLFFELSKIENDPFVTEIIDILSNFTGFGDKTRFDKLEQKLYVLQEHLEEYREDCSAVQIEDDGRIPEKEICDTMLRAISKLQRNHHYIIIHAQQDVFQIGTGEAVLGNLTDAAVFHIRAKDSRKHSPDLGFALAAVALNDHHTLSLIGWNQAVADELLQGGDVLRME